LSHVRHWSTNHHQRRESARLIQVSTCISDYVFFALDLILSCVLNIGMAQFVSNFAEPGDPEYAPPKPEVELPV